MKRPRLGRPLAATGPSQGTAPTPQAPVSSRRAVPLLAGLRTLNGPSVHDDGAEVQGLQSVTLGCAQATDNNNVSSPRPPGLPGTSADVKSQKVRFGHALVLRPVISLLRDRHVWSL